MIRDLYQWMLSWDGSPWASPALFLLAFAESSFFPLPPDILLMALTLGHPSWGMYYAALTTAGSVLGGLFGYLLGRLGGTPLLVRMIGRDRVSKAHEVFERHEGWAILTAALTPVPYKVFTLGAGALYVNVRVFVAASLIGRGARFFLVAGTLQLLGPWVRDLIERHLNLLTILLAVLLCLGFWLVGARLTKPRPAAPPASGGRTP